MNGFDTTLSHDYPGLSERFQLSPADPQDATLDTLAEGGAYLRRTIQLFGKHLVSPILEVGCGSGNITLELLASGHRVIATDIDQKRLTKLRQRFSGDGDKLHCQLLDLDALDSWQALPTQPGSVLAINVIEHVYDDVACARKIYDTLRAGGTFAVLVPAHQGLYSDFDRALGHHRRYTKESLHQLMSGAGFEVVSCRYFNLVGALGWFVNCTLLGKVEIPKRQFKLFEGLSPLLALEDHLSLPAGLSVVAIGRKPS